MPTTSNFGWTTPADTDLVKDGAAAIRTLGNGIDTSLVDLKGGTTGQILSKASNTDLDYTWITNDVGDITNVGVTAPITGGGSSGSVTIGIQDGTTAQKGAVQLENSTSSTSTTTAAVPASVKSAYDLADGAIPKSLVDAKGDLIVGTADNTVARLAVGGTNGHTLQVDSSTSTGLKWAAAAGGGKVLQVVQGTRTTNFTTTSASYVDLGLSVSITPSSATSKIMVMVSGYSYIYRSGSGTDNYGSLALVGGATQLQEHNIGYYQLASTSNAEIYIPMNFSYLDSPATTSAITYKTQGKTYSASTTLYLIAGATTIASIVAMEIGA